MWLEKVSNWGPLHAVIPGMQSFDGVFGKPARAITLPRGRTQGGVRGDPARTGWGRRKTLAEGPVTARGRLVFSENTSRAVVEEKPTLRRGV